MSLKIEAARPEHYKNILLLNEAAIPAVNSIDVEALSQLAVQACYFKVAMAGGEVAGFLLMLPAGAHYKSLNYVWFSERYIDFAYVDRIVIDPSFAGKGLGRGLYEDAVGILTPNYVQMTCEVNIKPRNDASLAFHAAMSFAEVGQQDTESGAKRVSLLSKPLAK